MDRATRGLCYDKGSAFRLSIWRSRPHAFMDCHEILNQRTWYKGLTTYVYVQILHFHPFSNRASFVSLLSIYGQTPLPTLIMFGIYVLGTFITWHIYMEGLFIGLPFQNSGPFCRYYFAVKVHRLDRFS